MTIWTIITLASCAGIIACAIGVIINGRRIMASLRESGQHAARAEAAREQAAQAAVRTTEEHHLLELLDTARLLRIDGGSWTIQARRDYGRDEPWEVTYWHSHRNYFRDAPEELTVHVCSADALDRVIDLANTLDCRSLDPLAVVRHRDCPGQHEHHREDG